MKADPFVGVWSLVSCIARSPSGDERLPVGEHAVGRLIYTSSGHMAATLSQSNRQPFESADKRGGSDAELRAAFESFDAYAGTYEVDSAASTVLHHVDLSSWPNIRGVDQVRYFRFDGDQLILTTPSILARGTEWNLTLCWRRLA